MVIGISAGMHTMVWKCQINYQKDFKLIVLALLCSQFPTCPQKLCLQKAGLLTSDDIETGRRMGYDLAALGMLNENQNKQP